MTAIMNDDRAPRDSTHVPAPAETARPDRVISVDDQRVATFAPDGPGVFVNYRVWDMEVEAATIAAVVAERLGRDRSSSRVVP